MSDFGRIHFWKKRKIERQIRAQIQKDAEIPDQVYKSAGKAFRMILDGTARQEQAPEEDRRSQLLSGDASQSAAAPVIPKDASQSAAAPVIPEDTPRSAAAPVIRKTAPRPWAGSGLFKAACSMAAVLLVCVIANAVFPVQVRALPIVGSIFERIQDAVGYEKLSEYARPLAGEEAGGAVDEQDYMETNGGLTVSVAEAYADSEVIYLSMKFKSDEPFPEGFYHLPGEDGEKMDEKVPMLFHANKKYSFMKDTGMELWNGYSIGVIVEGLMVNENTYEFLWRIELARDLGAYQKKVDKKAVLPDEFTLDVEIDTVHSMLSRDEIYRGPWNISIPIQVDDRHREVVEIRETGETGVGLISVEKTPFEITTRAVTPGPARYKVVVLDTKGNKLPNVLMNEIWFDEAEDEMHEKWRIEGHDVSSVEVFVLGRAFYENVYATGLWSRTDWDGNEKKPEEEKLGTMLRQYAEYHKVIKFEYTHGR